MVPALMILSDLWPDFKVATFSRSNMSKMVQDGAIATI